MSSKNGLSPVVDKDIADWRSLPFTGTKGGCWNLPATGGYSGGIDAGAACAMLYLQYLRSRKSRGDFEGLASAMGDLCDRIVAARTENETRILSGQMLGFLRVIDSVLIDVREKILPQDRATLEAQLKAGLEFDEKAYFAAYEREVRSGAAKRGWETRRRRARRGRKAA